MSICNLILVACYPRKQPAGKHSALQGVTPPKGGAQRGVTPPSFEMPLWLWTSWWGCQKGIFLVLAIFIVIIGIAAVLQGSFSKNFSSCRRSVKQVNDDHADTVNNCLPSSGGNFLPEFAGKEKEAVVGLQSCHRYGRYICVKISKSWVKK